MAERRELNRLEIERLEAELHLTRMRIRTEPLKVVLWAIAAFGLVGNIFLLLFL